MSSQDTASPTASTRSALDRDAWIRFATGVLAEEGLEGLRVEVLARRLKVTKGSFYWHFRDRQALLNAIATQWRDERIGELSSQVAVAPEQAMPQLHRIIDTYANQPNFSRMKLELAIRDWARRDPLVASVVEAVDQARLLNATRLFELAGFPPAHAHTRALLLFTHVFGLSMMMFERSIASEIAASHSAIAALITRPAD
ncbi:TetR/AcrR family transcriptional regulator [Uliginosibacterium paludis]|uniref:TetR/AcrR family transcriptional regulator n=1 Tax=Uliginosibacterium paludis TaxID=1615952 RepID=A0ABV2CS96_9RHOO